MKTTNYRFCALLASVVGLPLASYGLGFRITDQNASATARGNAFAATADNPSAIFYNPAGITELEGTRALLGAYSITLRTDVSLDLPGDKSKFSSLNDEFQTIPSFYVTWKPKDYPIALGLGVYAPYGFSLDYGDNNPFRTLAIKASIRYITINPVLAWKINDTLSVAAGPTINYSSAELVRGILNPGDQFKFKGDGVAYGFNAGIMWNPHAMHHFGLTYRSATRVDYSGHSTTHYSTFTTPTPFGPFTVPGADSREDSDASFDLPQNVVLGYSFRPTPDWNFEVNVDWTDWDHLNTVSIHQPSGDAPVPFNWRSSFIYDFGITKKFAHGVNVSVGYMYSQNSVPNESFNPQIPDTTRHIFSAGFGQGYDRFDWQLAYQFAYGPSRHIENGTLADGDYSFRAHALSLSLGYRF